MQLLKLLNSVKRFHKSVQQSRLPAIVVLAPHWASARSTEGPQSTVKRLDTLQLGLDEGRGCGLDLPGKQRVRWIMCSLVELLLFERHLKSDPENV